MAAAMAMAGLCRPPTLHPDSCSAAAPGLTNNAEEGLNLSTVGNGDSDRGDVLGTVDMTEDLDDEEMFLRHIDKTVQRRRKVGRKRDVDGRSNVRGNSNGILNGLPGDRRREFCYRYSHNRMIIFGIVSSCV